MRRLPPISTRTDTLFPSKTLCRAQRRDDEIGDGGGVIELFSPDGGQQAKKGEQHRTHQAEPDQRPEMPHAEPAMRLGNEHTGEAQIGRAHVRTPVTNAHLVCRLLLAKKKSILQTSACATLN